MTSAIIPLHPPVSLRLRIQREEAVRWVDLAGEGKIVRVERIKCNVPLNHLEENVVAYPTGYN